MSSKIELTAFCVFLMVSLCFASAGSALAAPPLPTAPYRPLYHQVRWGESLTRIAAQYNTTVYAIVQANRLPNANYIYAGQWLLIPTPATAPRAYVHVVRWGETLSSIARRYGTNAWTLARYNGIYNLNRIYVGQRLLIPDP